MTKKLKGHEVKLKYHKEGVGVIPMASCKSTSIDMKMDLIKVSGPNSGAAEEFIPGRTGWTIKNAMFLTTFASTLFDLWKNRTKIQIFMWLEHDYVKYMTGYCYITSLTMTGNVHDMAQMEISLQGSGPLEEDEY